MPNKIERTPRYRPDSTWDLREVPRTSRGGAHLSAYAASTHRATDRTGEAEDAHIPQRQRLLPGRCRESTREPRTRAAALRRRGPSARSNGRSPPCARRENPWLRRRVEIRRSASRRRRQSPRRGTPRGIRPPMRAIRACAGRPADRESIPISEPGRRERGFRRYEARKRRDQTLVASVGPLPPPRFDDAAVAGMPNRRGAMRLAL